MDLFKGLNAHQIGTLRHVRDYARYLSGEIIFAEGDQANDLCAVVSGQVSIFRKTLDGEVELARLGPRETFGEMGLLNQEGWRTASARAVEETVLMRFGGNPMEFFQKLGDAQAALTILQNLIGLLAERLRKKDSPDWVPLRERSVPQHLQMGVDSESAIRKLRDSLPHGILHRILGEKRLHPGEVLCLQGDQPEGFYFIHDGTLEVEHTEPEGLTRVLGRLRGPTIAGEIGFFSGEKRSSTLTAVTAVRYEVFSGSEFRKLASKSPGEAFNVLFAAAQLVVCLILQREEG